MKPFFRWRCLGLHRSFLVMVCPRRPVLAGWLAAACLLYTAGSAAGAVLPTAGEIDWTARWITNHFRGSPAQLPVSFEYAGQPAGDWLDRWPVVHTLRELDARRVEHVVTRRDPQNGLAMRWELVQYRDFPVVEWTLRVKNEGAQASAIWRELHPLDLRLKTNGQYTLNYHTGDQCTPDSYEPHRCPLPPKSRRDFAPVGGRPCNQAFPYFNLEWPGAGLLLAIGWPGQWAASFECDASGGMRVWAGQEKTHFRLLPGEEVRTPLVALLFYQGERIRAQNLWRRWMLAHNLPRGRDGEPPPPMLSSCSGGFFPGLKCNEPDEFRFIDAFQRQGIGLDYWWMDAGWYPCGNDWPMTGTWEPDPERFPRGLRAVTDFAHQKGLRSIVWFEPERVAPGTWLYQNHPSWLLGRDGSQKLLNLGSAEARSWLAGHVDHLLKTQGIDLYRQDFNVDPLDFWRANDAPDRQGITEIRHVEGYLAYWDELRRRNPGLLIDSCASGGRRNDLETLRRAVPLLRSDYQSFQGDLAFAPGNQCHTYGLASWFPFYGQGFYYQPDRLEYNARSHFCPALGLAVDVRQPGIDWPRLKRVVEDWRKISADLLGDFYPLTPYSLAEEVWMAWQFDCPEKGEGVVQAFRRRDSPYESARFQLWGLEPEARYKVTDLDAAESREATGRELRNPGLEIRLAQKSAAAIVIYQKAR